MGIFRNKDKKKKHTFDDIASVVILEQTQQYRSKTEWGLTFGDKGFLDGSVIAMDRGQIPSGALITFSVTYKDGKREVIKEYSGTAQCDRLLQLALDPQTTSASPDGSASARSEQPFVLGKNQLPAGSYLVGKDIPAGTFDLTCVFGSGSVSKYKNDHDTTLGACTYYEHVGNRYDYEYRQCLNVECLEGENLVVQGNLIIGLARSKQPEINL